MLVAERRHAIRNLIVRQGSVKISDLVSRFRVSQETIRRDLYMLEREGILIKSHGGATLSAEESGFSPVTPVNQRLAQNSDEKERIGKAAAALVENGHVVLLDGGTTNHSIVRNLREKSNLTIVTNGVTVAAECRRAELDSIYLLGGQLNKETMSLVGPRAQSELSKYSAHIAFVGTNGISLRRGFTSSDMYEGEIKRGMMSVAQRTVVVADHTKFDGVGFVSFAAFSDIDILITSTLADEGRVREIERMGVTIIRC